MNKIITLIICMVLTIVTLSSCASAYQLTQTETRGDVSIISPMGEHIKSWENVSIETKTTAELNSTFTSTTTSSKNSSLKSFGLNFYDDINEEYVILSNAVPYIITYKTSVTTSKIIDNRYDWIKITDDTTITTKKNTPLEKIPSYVVENKYLEFNDVLSLKRFKQEITWAPLYKLINKKTSKIDFYIVKLERDYYLVKPMQIL